MLRFGLFRLLAVLVFGVVIPWATVRLSRTIGAPLTLVGAAALGLAYGAIKADHPWAGEGLADNLQLMGLSVAVIVGYAGVSLAAARALVRFRRSRP